MVYKLPLVLLKAAPTTRMLFGFTLALSLALSLASKTRRKLLFGYRLPGTLDMDAYFPVWLVKAVIVAFEVKMVGKIHYNIDATTRIVNKLHVLVFVAIPVCGSVRGWAMSVSRARSCANRWAPARRKHKHCASQNNR